MSAVADCCAGPCRGRAGSGRLVVRVDPLAIVTSGSRYFRGVSEMPRDRGASPVDCDRSHWSRCNAGSKESKPRNFTLVNNSLSTDCGPVRNADRDCQEFRHGYGRVVRVRCPATTVSTASAREPPAAPLNRPACNRYTRGALSAREDADMVQELARQRLSLPRLGGDASLLRGLSTSVDNASEIRSADAQALRARRKINA